jgi:hypothetical protein
MHVRLQSWFPFPIQVYIHGREWLAQKIKRAGMEFTPQDNCFTRLQDVRKAQRWMVNSSQGGGRGGRSAGSAR